MKALLKDTRVQRLLLANITGSIGSGVTIIAVPWLLVHRANGDQLYGYVTLGTTLALFLFMPYYGTWIDRHSRKTMLLIGESFGFCATLFMGLLALVSGKVETWQLMTTYFCGMLYFTLHYPAKYAFLQQIIDRQHYQSLTGLMEVQGQTASMLAGGLAGLLIDRVPLSTILLADASTYLFSFVIQSTIPYTATHLSADAPRPATGAWHAMAEGWRWLRAHPRLSIFFACTLVPFVLVMVSNFLFPVYVTGTLHASAAVFGYGEIVFSLGALLAGLFIPRLASAHGADQTIVYTLSAGVVSLVMLVSWHSEGAYYAALLLFGLGNAGSRVARNALVLHRVPNAVMGRVGMFFNAADRLLRTVLTFVCTLIVAHHGAALGFAVLLVVLLLAFAGTLATRTAVRDGGSPALA
jgi:MFS family permease